MALALPLSASASCASFFTMPEPLAVVLDFERRAILFAVDPQDAGSWPATRVSRVSVPNTKDSVALSLAHTNRQIDAAPVGSVWIDVTSAYTEIASRLFPTLGPNFADSASSLSVAEGLDSYNCHRLTGMVCLETATKSVRANHIEQAGFVEIDPEHRSYARVVLYSGINPKDGSQRSSHSAISLPGTQWAIHKMGDGQTVLGADRLENIEAHYGRAWELIVRYFTTPDTAQKLGPVRLAWRTRLAARGRKRRRLRDRLAAVQAARNVDLKPLTDLDTPDPRFNDVRAGDYLRSFLVLIENPKKVFEFDWRGKAVRTWADEGPEDGDDKAPPKLVFAVETPADARVLYEHLTTSLLLYNLTHEQELFSNKDERYRPQTDAFAWVHEKLAGAITRDGSQWLLTIEAERDRGKGIFSTEQIRLMSALLRYHGLNFAEQK